VAPEAPKTPTDARAFAEKPRLLRVSREANGMRVDAFVVSALAGPDAASRAVVQRWIADGRVTTLGKPRRAADKVRAGELLHVDPAPPERTDVRPEEGIFFEVLHVDEALVVVNKPAGLVVHPSRGHATGTLVHGLLARGWFVAGDPTVSDPLDREGHLRPGIVHRLDRGTSGVLVVARTARAREGLKDQFARHTIERVYDALALGRVTAKRHETLHGRHPKDRLRFTTHVREGKRAATEVEVVERYGDLATYLHCRLETGRTHQIRVHLAESGTPILGDPLYGRPPEDQRLRALGESLGHQALHARVLGFVHPVSGKTLHFEAEPPPDFIAARDALRLRLRAPDSQD
jgi:23S rRNA pseudouridine1911/1915/1917 synthase